MTATPLEQKIAEIIAPSLEGLGFDLVRVAFNQTTLQIMAERAGGQPVTLDDCAAISRTVSALLDVADPISTPYRLEVSSTGIDRPLVKLADFARFISFTAKVECMVPVNGRKRFQGDLIAVEGENIHLQLPDAEEVSIIPHSAIDRAKLVITDALIAHAQKQKQLSQETA